MIKRKKLKQGVNLQSFLGEHEGYKFDQKYKIKNINEIRHIITKHNNPLSKFEIDLRNPK